MASGHLSGKRKTSRFFLCSPGRLCSPLLRWRFPPAWRNAGGLRRRFMVDSAGLISFANAPAATVFGYSLSELIGCNIETLIPERFRDRHGGYRKDFLSEPSHRAMGAGRDLFGRRKDGSEFPVEVGLNPIHTTEGLSVLASVIDITARKQAELEHQLQNMELARVGRVAVMGELAASLAHE